MHHVVQEMYERQSLLTFYWSNYIVRKQVRLPNYTVRPIKNTTKKLRSHRIYLHLHMGKLMDRNSVPLKVMQEMNDMGK